MGFLLETECAWPANVDASRPRGRQAFARAAPDEGPLVLGEGAGHLEHHSPGGRGRVDRFGQRAELHTTGVQLVDDPHEVDEGSAEPVDPDDNEGVAPAEGTQACLPLRTVGRCTGGVVNIQDGIQPAFVRASTCAPSSRSSVETLAYPVMLISEPYRQRFDILDVVARGFDSSCRCLFTVTLEGV